MKRSLLSRDETYPDVVLREAFALKRNYLEPGFCPGGTKALIKELAGASGDHIKVEEGEIFINDRGTKALIQSHDSSGRKLPAIPIAIELSNDELFILSSHDKSFDSRYFGAVGRRNVIGVVEAIWLMGELRSGGG